jgi:hypothetical protein
MKAQGLDLVPNPLAAITTAPGTEEGDSLAIYAPQRGVPLAARVVSAAAEPALFPRLHEILRAPEGTAMELVGALPAEHAPRLRALGLLLPRSRVPTWPKFSCTRIDARMARAAGGLPPGTREHLADALNFRQGRVAVLRDRRTGLRFPYWIDRTTTPGDDRGPARDAEGGAWSEELARARTDLRAKGYAVVGDVVPRAQLAALAKYYLGSVDSGLLAVEGAPPTARWHRHGGSVAVLFHHLLAPLVARLAPEKIKPSYPYAAVYPRGACLAPHVDREQCEYTVSLLAAVAPARAGVLRWPLCVEGAGTRGEVVRLYQRPGDIVIFKGRELRHWRPRLRVAARSLHMFFHFVPRAFTGPLE